MDLTSVEEKLITALAEKGPLTGYALHNIRSPHKIMSNAHWERVKDTLGPNGHDLIFEIESDGISKPCWLTGFGINQALKLGAKPEILEKFIKEIYEEEKAEMLLILTSVAKNSEISPEIWDYITDLGKKMARGQSTTHTLLEMFANISQEMLDTLVVLGTSHEKLGPMVAKTMCLANKELKEKMKQG